MIPSLRSAAPRRRKSTINTDGSDFGFKYFAVSGGIGGVSAVGYAGYTIMESCKVNPDDSYTYIDKDFWHTTLDCVVVAPAFGVMMAVIWPVATSVFIAQKLFKPEINDRTQKQ